MIKESRFMNEKNSEMSAVQNRPQFWQISHPPLLLLAQQINHTDTDSVTI